MKLIIFSGLPGTGKSTLAEAIGQNLGISVFAKDWLEATLVQCELKSTKEEKSLGMARIVACLNVSARMKRFIVRG